MGIMDRFSSIFPAQNPAQGQPVQQQQPAVNDNSRQLEQNTGQSTGEQTQQTQQTPAKKVAPPLDEFKTLWQDEPIDPANPPKKKDDSFLGIDPTKIKEHVSKMDFSKSIDPALVAKALGGDQAAFLQVIQQATSAAFTASISATHSLVERGLKTAQTRTFERLPSELRKHSLNDASFSDNPAMNHEAIRPLLQSIQQQMAEKYPDASTKELQGMAKRYLQGTFELVFPQSKEQSRQPRKNAQGTTVQERLQNLNNTGADFDWDKFITGEGQTVAEEDNLQP